jgi:hypothetical protein
VLGGGATTEKGQHLASEARFDDTVRMTTEKNTGVEVQHVQCVGTGETLSERPCGGKIGEPGGYEKRSVCYLLTFMMIQLQLTC